MVSFTFVVSFKSLSGSLWCWGFSLTESEGQFMSHESPLSMFTFSSSFLHREENVCSVAV